jgi:uncharacterized membrane protein
MKIDKELLLKSIAYRVFSIVITIFVTWIITGNIFSALTVGFIDSFLKVIYYYVFEKLWKNV